MDAAGEVVEQLWVLRPLRASPRQQFKGRTMIQAHPPFVAQTHELT